MDRSGFVTWSAGGTTTISAIETISWASSSAATGSASRIEIGSSGSSLWSSKIAPASSSSMLSGVSGMRFFRSAKSDAAVFSGGSDVAFAWATRPPTSIAVSSASESFGCDGLGVMSSSAVPLRRRGSLGALLGDPGA